MAAARNCRSYSPRLVCHVRQLAFKIFILYRLAVVFNSVSHFTVAAARNSRSYSPRLVVSRVRQLAVLIISLFRD